MEMEIQVDITFEERIYLQETNWNDEKSRLNNYNELNERLLIKGILYIVQDDVDTIYYLTDVGKQIVQRLV